MRDGTDPKATGEALGRHTGALTPGPGQGRKGTPSTHILAHTGTVHAPSACGGGEASRGSGSHLTLSLLLVSGCLQQLLQLLPHHVLARGGTQRGSNAFIQEVLQQSRGAWLCLRPGCGSANRTWQGLPGAHASGHCKDQVSSGQRLEEREMGTTGSCLSQPSATRRTLCQAHRPPETGSGRKCPRVKA